MMPDYQKICSNILSGLSEKVRDVITRRFGLGGKEVETLESIGEDYHITRERVRQLQEFGFNFLKRPETLKNCETSFDYFEKYFEKKGGLKKEEIALKELGGNDFQNNVFFLLRLSGKFLRQQETSEFYPFWYLRKELLDLAEKILKQFIDTFQKAGRPINKKEFLKNQFNLLNKFRKNRERDRGQTEEILQSTLEISKKIGENPFAEIGLKSWPEIYPRSLNDKIYLILKMEQRPLHFQEISARINELNFPKYRKALVQSVHNSLIKNQKFVLVGRGIYALSEKGYKPGFTKDVISQILKDSKKPLSKEDIIEKVLTQRMVKKNTILLNLADKNYFLENERGKYTLREI